MIAALHCRSRDIVSRIRCAWGGPVRGGRYFVRSARDGAETWLFYSHRLKPDEDYVTESGAFGRLFSAERRWYLVRIRRIRGVGRPL